MEMGIAERMIKVRTENINRNLSINKLLSSNWGGLKFLASFSIRLGVFIAKQKNTQKTYQK